MAKVCVAQIVGVHGVRGMVKLRSFTQDPAAVVAYGPLTDESGRRSFALSLHGAVRDSWLARIEGVTDRTMAEALRGIRLFVDRSALPAPAEEEFYHADLIGLRAELTDGTELGAVVAVHDFGAGDMLEVRLAGGRTVMVPFTRAVVPVVDVAGGRVALDPPAGLLDRPVQPDAVTDRATDRATDRDELAKDGLAKDGLAKDGLAKDGLNGEAM